MKLDLLGKYSRPDQGWRGGGGVGVAVPALSHAGAGEMKCDRMAGWKQYGQVGSDRLVTLQVGFVGIRWDSFGVPMDVQTPKFAVLATRRGGRFCRVQAELLDCS